MEVAVLGAGTEGRGIAELCALGGHDVRLYGTEANAVMDAIDAVEAAMAEDATGVAEPIDGTTGLEAAVSGATLVVDALDGDRETRRDRFAEIETLVDEETLVATCGATVSITAVAAGLRRPGRALGLQFIDPPVVPLVEVVVAEQTTERTRERAVAFVDGLDREAVVVGDVPGFATTRLQLALTAEAVRMVEDGVAGIEAIDRAAERGAGHEVGPLVAADLAGLDARREELDYLADALGERFSPPALLDRKVGEGDLGRKTGEGFYVWERGEPVEPSDPDPTPELRTDSPADPSDAGDP